MAQEPQKSNSAGIIIAIIGVIGAVIAALITVIGNYNVERMRQQAELTQIVLISQPTQMASQSAGNVPIDSIAPTTSLVDVNQACQSLLGIIPDSPEEVRTNFAIPPDKSIRIIYEICQEAPNGFIIEESPSLFTLEVPSGGCIDSYSGAEFSEATVPEQQFGGRRAYGGTVTTTSLTYRIAGCELKP